MGARRRAQQPTHRAVGRVLIVARRAEGTYRRACLVAPLRAPLRQGSGQACFWAARDDFFASSKGFSNNNLNI